MRFYGLSPGPVCSSQWFMNPILASPPDRHRPVYAARAKSDDPRGAVHCSYGCTVNTVHVWYMIRHPHGFIPSRRAQS